MGRTRGWVLQSEVGSDNAAQSGSRAKKKPRIAKPKAATTTRKRGKKVPPKRLLDLPSAAFNEISKYLTPVDLLSLARTNKFFRKMFLSRASQHLWKTAMNNISNMPPCPEELSEPQYISLLYSPTCSSCGTNVFHRRMDPYLLVRLCDSCLEDQVEEWRGDNSNIQFLPHTHLIGKPQSSTTSVLKSDVEDMNRSTAKGQKGVAAYKKARSKRAKERQTVSDSIPGCPRPTKVDEQFGDKLEDFLDWMELEPMDGLEQRREQRWEQIKTRLLAEGWKEEEFQLRYSPEWKQLVWQPRPVTDRNWPELREELLPFVKKTYYMTTAQRKRREARIDKLQAFTRAIWNPLPPLVHVTLKLPHRDFRDIRARIPFPSTNEFLMWPMIRNIVEDDISPEDAEVRFKDIKDEVVQAITEWRDQLEQDVIEIWNSGPHGRNQVPSATPHTTGSTALRAVGRAFPEFVVTYGKPDGTTTTNLSELSPNMQALLRADVMFKGDWRRHYFPDIVPEAYSWGTLIGFPEEVTYGERWDKRKFKRDDDLSAMARNLLARVGRPNAVGAEMQALGRGFICGRCHWTMSDDWEGLVRHYTAEQSQARLAQEKIRANPKSGFVYRNTHDLGPGNPKPFAHFLTSSQASDLDDETMDYQFYTMSCIKCEEMGIPARYSYTRSRNVDSPMLEHLRDVCVHFLSSSFLSWLTGRLCRHGIPKGKMGVHFKPLPLPGSTDEE
ncbi:hypothetical protein FRC12_015311 [Ceratobasidium sp. 428]|nr:hypothetical protein FRC12_015311 [Ceratobasidium sp. 428]